MVLVAEGDDVVGDWGAVVFFVDDVVPFGVYSTAAYLAGVVVAFTACLLGFDVSFFAFGTHGITLVSLCPVLWS